MKQIEPTVCAGSEFSFGTRILMKKDPDLQSVDCRRLGEFQLRLESRPLRQRVGWTGFSIFLEDRAGRTSSRKGVGGEYVFTPVVEGIHSRGGKGIKSWIEVENYFPVLHFRGGMLPEQTISLSETGADGTLFRILADLLPPGGHLMFAYDVSYESDFHRETSECLIRNVPAVCTPMGKLLFDAGLRLVKDWYLAEGGYEGPRKLWGEKPVDDGEARRFDAATFLRVLAFSVSVAGGVPGQRELNAVIRATEVLTNLELEPPLSQLRKKVAAICGECPDPETLESAARRACETVNTFRPEKIEDVAVAKELTRIARECSADFSRKGR